MAELSVVTQNNPPQVRFQAYENKSENVHNGERNFFAISCVTNEAGHNEDSGNTMGNISGECHDKARDQNDCVNRSHQHVAHEPRY